MSALVRAYAHSTSGSCVPAKEAACLQDKERGVVWEESIILLPDTCQYAFLSATIPNAYEFAQWIATTHHRKCHVVWTDFRPVPLQHYIMPCGGPKPALYCVVCSRLGCSMAIEAIVVRIEYICVAACNILLQAQRALRDGGMRNTIR